MDKNYVKAMQVHLAQLELDIDSCEHTIKYSKENIALAKKRKTLEQLRLEEAKLIFAKYLATEGKRLKSKI